MYKTFECAPPYPLVIHVESIGSHITEIPVFGLNNIY